MHKLLGFLGRVGGRLIPDFFCLSAIWVLSAA
jgi:hypothetical protein